MLCHRKPKCSQTALLYLAFLVAKLPRASLAPWTMYSGRGSFKISMISFYVLPHSNKPFKPHSSCTSAMLSVAVRPASCIMYIKEVMYILMYIKESMYIMQSQQVQHNWHAMPLTLQLTSAIPSLSYTAKHSAAADHRLACLCDICGASLALVALVLHVPHPPLGVPLGVSCDGYIAP